MTDTSNPELDAWRKQMRADNGPAPIFTPDDSRRAVEEVFVDLERFGVRLSPPHLGDEEPSQ